MIRPEFDVLYDPASGQRIGFQIHGGRGAYYLLPYQMLELCNGDKRPYRILNIERSYTVRVIDDDLLRQSLIVVETKRWSRLLFIFWHARRLARKVYIGVLYRLYKLGLYEHEDNSLATWKRIKLFWWYFRPPEIAAPEPVKDDRLSKILELLDIERNNK